MYLLQHWIVNNTENKRDQQYDQHFRDPIHSPHHQRSAA
jgi:hypothetical protein